MIGLSETLIYLLVILIEVLQPAEPVAVDYLQDSAPAMVVSVEPVRESDNDVYVANAVPVGETEAPPDSGMFGPIRIEQSDLFAHNYIVYVPGSPPAVIDLAEVRRQLARLTPDAADGIGPDLKLDLAESGGSVHVLRRGPVTLVASDADGVVLLAR